MGSMLDVFADGDPSYALVIGAVGWFLAGLAVLRVREDRVASPTHYSARKRTASPPPGASAASR